MKYILSVFSLSLLLLSACDNSDELTPRIEDVTDTDITIPTSRLSYEEQDFIAAERLAFEQAVAERAGEN